MFSSLAWSPARRRMAIAGTAVFFVFVNAVVFFWWQSSDSVDVSATDVSVLGTTTSSEQPADENDAAPSASIEVSTTMPGEADDSTSNDQDERNAAPAVGETTSPTPAATAPPTTARPSTTRVSLTERTTTTARRTTTTTRPTSSSDRLGPVVTVSSTLTIPSIPSSIWDRLTSTTNLLDVDPIPDPTTTATTVASSSQPVTTGSTSGDEADDD